MSADVTFTERMIGRAGLPRFISVGLVALTFLPLAAGIDFFSSTTTIITPLAPGVLRTFLVGGGLLGLSPAALIAAANWYSSGLRGRSPAVAASAFFSMAVMFAPLYAVASDYAAWRFTEIAAFGSSAPAGVPHSYRVLSWRTKRNKAEQVVGYEASIAPYGEWASLPISLADYRKLADDDRPGWGSRYCIAVQEQRAGRTVRLLDQSQPVGTDSQLTPCMN